MRREATTLGLLAVLPFLAWAQGQVSRTYSVPQVLEVVGKAVDQPAPAGLNAADRQAWAAQTEWLRGVRDRLKAITDSSGSPPSGERVSGTAPARQGSPATQAQRVEEFRKAIETEGRRFNTLSNASKARHDIAMNAIRNMKG